MRARAPHRKHFYQNLNFKTKSRHIEARSYGSPAQPLPRRNLHNMSFLLLYDMYHCYIWRWLSRPKRPDLWTTTWTFATRTTQRWPLQLYTDIAMTDYVILAQYRIPLIERACQDHCGNSCKP